MRSRCLFESWANILERTQVKGHTIMALKQQWQELGQELMRSCMTHNHLEFESTFSIGIILSGIVLLYREIFSIFLKVLKTSLTHLTNFDQNKNSMLILYTYKFLYMVSQCCREDPSLCADREAEPPGFWTGRIQSRYKLWREST